MQFHHTMRCVVFALALCAVSIDGGAVDTDRTITKVVKLLQAMMEKSQAEGEEERVIYAKFKCYCDTSEAEKKASIEDNTKKISILESKIEELQGSNGESSSSSAELKAQMMQNKQERDEATSIRNKENKAFKANRDDLTQAIGQMKDALKTLAAVGGDQTKSSGAADNKKFMAGFKASSMLQLQSSMKDALSAAQAFMTKEQSHAITSFIQAPFTGSYTSQSAQVTGILKSMRDTFKANKADAIATEKAAKEAYDKIMELKEEEFEQMKEQLKKAQDTLGGNDSDLSAKRKQLAEAEKAKAEDEEFLEKLIPMCEEKAKQYNARKLDRANEEAAVSEAISILNSDSAFQTFGGVSATSDAYAGQKAAFIQLSAVHRHIPDADVRAVMQRLLKRAAVEAGNHGRRGSAPRLNRVISLLHAENPFDTVLAEIEKMIGNIEEEGKADAEKKAWCEKERKDNKKDLKKKNAELLKLEGKIEDLDKAINDPATGLKADIAATEQSLLENSESQKTETADRLEANMAYQKDVKNLVDAEKLVANAIEVLKGYYDKFDAKFLQQQSAFLQQHSRAKEDPAAPETWGEYKGQSEDGGGAIGMLKFILGETNAEQLKAHTDEEKAQADYEDSMQALKDEEAKKEKSLATLQKTLAEKEQDLLEAEDDHKSTFKDKEAIEDYLDKIRAGCDFIKENFSLREKSRATEKAALKTAAKTLKGSPAYKNAEADATVESYGKCKEPCVEDSADVKCKACMADVTIPAYCAGHGKTKGC